MNATRLFTILMVVAALLLIPFIGMQFSNEVNWSTFDFLLMGTLLLFTGFAVNFALVKLKTRQNKIIACVVILGTFLLIWAELAVGIFGTPFAGS